MEEASVSFLNDRLFSRIPEAFAIGCKQYQVRCSDGDISICIFLKTYYDVWHENILYIVIYTL